MCRGINLPIRDKIEDEEEIDKNAKVEVVLNPEEEQIFKAISKIGKWPNFEVPTFLINLNLDDLIDWINELEEYFEYEDINDPNRVMFGKVKLKGHAKI